LGDERVERVFAEVGDIDLLVANAHRAAERCHERGYEAAFHYHGGTYVETPREIDRFAERMDASLIGFCFDSGHSAFGGGDPVAFLDTYGELVSHVHLKDVDGAVLARLRGGEIASFADAVRARLFTELGNGILDLRGVLARLGETGYDGWLMVEQDSSWLPPSEASAISNRVLRYALRSVAT